MVISKFFCNRSLAFTFRKNLFDFFFCKFIKFIHRYLHVQRVFSNMVRLTRFQRARSLLQKFLRFLCLAFHHKRISRAGLRTCYDLFSHGDPRLESMNHLLVFVLGEAIHPWCQGRYSKPHVSPQRGLGSPCLPFAAPWHIYARLSEPPLLAQVTSYRSAPGRWYHRRHK